VNAEKPFLLLAGLHPPGKRFFVEVPQGNAADLVSGIPVGEVPFESRAVGASFFLYLSPL